LLGYKTIKYFRLLNIMEYIATRIDNIDNLVNLLDSDTKDKFNHETLLSTTKINNAITEIEQILITYDFDDFDTNKIKLDNRKNKILDQCMFMVYWHIGNKLEHMTEEQIEHIEESKNKFADCLKNIIQ